MAMKERIHQMCNRRERVRQNMRTRIPNEGIHRAPVIENNERTRSNHPMNVTYSSTHSRHSRLSRSYHGTTRYSASENNTSDSDTSSDHGSDDVSR